MPDFAEFITKCSYIPDSHCQHLLDRVFNKEREDILYNFSWWEPTLLALLPNLEELKMGVRSTGRECCYRSNSYTMELFKAVFCRVTAPIGLEKLHSLEVGDASLEDFTMLATLPSLRSLSMVATQCYYVAGNTLWSHKPSSNVTTLRIADCCAIWRGNFRPLIAGFSELKEFSYSISHDYPFTYAKGRSVDPIKEALLAFATNLHSLKIDLPAGARIQNQIYIESLRDFTKLRCIETNHIALMPSDETIDSLTDVLLESCKMLRLNDSQQCDVSDDSLTDILAESLLKGGLEHKYFPYLKQITTQNLIKPSLRAPWEQAGVSFSVD